MNKICGVCGDRAYGYNFGAITCESCRSFFRRTALKTQIFTCFYDQNCQIDYMSRKFCKKCRLDKCLEIGMRKESIRSYGLKKSKISRNLSPYGNQINDLTTDTSDESVVMECHSVEQNQQIVNYKASPFPALIRGLVLNFSPFEFSRLKDLFSAASNLKEQIVSTSSETKDFMTVTKIMHRRCDTKCRKIVKMSTDMNEFVNLCENDKIFLLKAGSPELINLISVYNFDFQGQFWTITTDENNSTKISLSALKFISQTLYESHKRFLLSMKEQLNQDINILDLLAGIVLFNPNRPDLINRDLVRLEEQTYEYLLQRYLELKYESKIVAQNRFLQLMNCIEEVRALSRLHELAYLERQPRLLKGFGPLVEEIYDVDRVRVDTQ